MTTTTAPRQHSRRTALRLAFVAVPAVAGLTLAGTANAGTTTTTTTTGGVTIDIIDAVSATTTGTAAATRRALVPGAYKPGPDTTGPIPGTTLTRINGDYTATADNQIIENLEVYGTINTKTFNNVVVRNCVVWGTQATGTFTAFIMSSGENGRGLTVEDCRFNGRNNPWVSGMRGGNYTIRRTEITGAADGLSLTSALGNVTAEANWLHNGYYAEWDATTTGVPAQGGYYTHTDGVQFHRGKNYVIRGNLIGGTRNPADHHTGKAATIAAGDDFYNSAFMIKQEVDATPANKIENVLIENNWLTGGVSTINISSGNGNTFNTLIIRNNRFTRSTWGNQMYILQSPGLGTITGNVYDDTNTPITISKGA
jgi:hypothetical protein